MDTIRDRILDLTLAPGSRIDEKLLMERFRLSRTPARDALNTLLAGHARRFQERIARFIGYSRSFDFPIS